MAYVPVPRKKERKIQLFHLYIFAWETSMVLEEESDPFSEGWGT